MSNMTLICIACGSQQVREFIKGILHAVLGCLLILETVCDLNQDNIERKEV